MREVTSAPRGPLPWLAAAVAAIVAVNTLDLPLTARRLRVQVEPISGPPIESRPSGGRWSSGIRLPIAGCGGLMIKMRMNFPRCDDGCDADANLLSGKSGAFPARKGFHQGRCGLFVEACGQRSIRNSSSSVPP